MTGFRAELRRLADWVGGLSPVPVAFVEPGYKQDLLTLPQPLVELYLVTEGEMQMVVGHERARLRAGDLALANAHFGNAGEAAGGGYRYGCVSIAGPFVAPLAGWVGTPLLVVHRAAAPERVRSAFQEVASVYHGPAHDFRDVLLKAALLRLIAAAGETEASTGAAIRNVHVLRAIEVMSCRRSDPGLSVSEIARSVGLTTNHLVRVFRTNLATTPGRYLAGMRIQAAQDLLVHSGFSIKEIAAMLGFSDQLYFSRVFRQKTGRSPRAFRQARAEARTGG